MRDSRENKANSFVGEQIRRFRTDKSLSQEELASRLGLTHRALGNMELGRASIPIGRLFLIADILDLPVGAFIPASEFPDDGKRRRVSDASTATEQGVTAP